MMMRRRRPDGVLVDDAPGCRRFMPALMPTRSGSVVPIFGALGKVRETVEVEDAAPVVARTASMKFTYDERVEDGLYAAGVIADFQAMVEHPDEG